MFYRVSLTRHTVALGAEEAGKGNGVLAIRLRTCLYSHDRQRESGDKGMWTPSSLACHTKWGRNFFLLNIVSTLLEIQMIESMNQRMGVCFSHSSPSMDLLHSLSPLSPLLQLTSLLPFLAVGGQLNSLL